MKTKRTSKRRATVRNPEFKGPCMWFALCDRPATGFTRHSVLGDVPTCDRCHKFATGKERSVS